MCLLAWPMPARAWKIYNALLVLLAVMTYIHGNLLYWETGVLDGNSLQFASPFRSLIDAGLWLVLTALAWRFRQWLTSYGWKICSVLILFQVI